MQNQYNHREIEKKWQAKWEESKIYEPNLDKAKKPFYNLMMFPYPSAEGLHVGNMYAFAHSDAYGRFIRLQGYDVFEPIGLDGFGIHSENYAIKINEHIRDVSERTEANFYAQLRAIGNQYDWSRKIETYKPNYYKWTQWLFLKMYEKGLAYRKKSLVNWCGACKTVLSDEQIVGGECERCGSIAEKKEMKQWFFRITDYADRLLGNLENMDWPDEVKTIQKNWIGKRQGAEIQFSIFNDQCTIPVFTTRPDTIFGATFLALCPEHDLVRDLKKIKRLDGGKGAKNWEEIKEYVKKAKNKSDLARTDLNKDKTGVKIEGIKAINPLTKEEIPIFIADYVLPNYGTGAIMAVPAADARDFEFARKYGLAIRQVVSEKGKTKTPEGSEVFAESEGNPRYRVWHCQTNNSLAQVKKNVNDEPVEGFEPSGQRLTTPDPYQTTGLSSVYQKNLDKTKTPEEDRDKKITGAGAILETKEGKFLFQKRDKNAAYSPYMIALFGGRAEAGETSKQAIIRELREELNLEVDEALPQAAGIFESHNKPGELIQIYHIHGIDPAKLEIQEGERIVKTSLKEALENPDVTNFTKEAIKNFEPAKCFAGSGICVNSDFLNGLETEIAKEKIIDYLEEKGIGTRRINYKLRDWCVSRQRYWGPPIPLVYCKACEDRKYNYILIHGFKDNASKYFFPYLKESLTRDGHEVFAPNLPNPRKPNIEEQVEYILNNAKIDENTIIMGHSLGGVAAMKLAEKLKGKIKKLILVDSFFKPEFRDKKRKALIGSTDWNFDFSAIRKNAEEIVILADSNYPTISREQSFEMKNKLEANLILAKPAESHFQGNIEERILELLAPNGWIKIKEENLPVKLPEMDDFLPDGTGKGPLNKIEEFVKIECPECGGEARRETDVSDPFVDSCWYYTRYLCTEFERKALDKERLAKWLPVDMYIGGKEHSVLHLLYSRFVNMVMHELGYAPEEEPFKKFRAHGLVVKDGAKMSKSKGNVVNPDKYIEKYGADTVRAYLLFMGDMRQGGDWRDSGVAGMHRFLKRVASLPEKVRPLKTLAGRSEYDELNRLIHKTIKSVKDKLENLKFNTAISDIMVLVNAMSQTGLLAEELGILAILISPFAPHLAEELWAAVPGFFSEEDKENKGDLEKYKQSVFAQTWPQHNDELAKDDLINLVLQVNGKIRDKVEATPDISEDEARQIALSSAKIQAWISGKEVVKIIFAPGKLVNVVIR